VDPAGFAAAIDAEIEALPDRSTQPMREVRKHHSAALRQADAASVLALARALDRLPGRRWIAAELVRYHKGAFSAVTQTDLEAFAEGLDAWETVDAFGCVLAGPAWFRGRMGDDLVERWASSPDLWMRRLALVCTVGFNRPGAVGPPCTEQTLRLCRKLAGDSEDMVEKAVSWALRELLKRDRQAVIDFMSEQGDGLAARVRREVRNKLATGLKNPRAG